MTTNPRNANGHRRRQLRARVLAEEDICWLCGSPVDKTLKTPHPGSPEIDEIIPVSLGGDPLARSNCRLAHRRPVQRPPRQRHTRAGRGQKDATVLDLEVMVTRSNPKDSVCENGPMPREGRRGREGGGGSVDRRGAMPKECRSAEPGVIPRPDGAAPTWHSAVSPPDVFSKTQAAHIQNLWFRLAAAASEKALKAAFALSMLPPNNPAFRGAHAESERSASRRN